MKCFTVASHHVLAGDGRPSLSSGRHFVDTAPVLYGRLAILAETAGRHLILVICFTAAPIFILAGDGRPSLNTGQVPYGRTQLFGWGRSSWWPAAVGRPSLEQPSQAERPFDWPSWLDCRAWPETENQNRMQAAEGPSDASKPLPALSTIRNSRSATVSLGALGSEVLALNSAKRSGPFCTLDQVTRHTNEHSFEENARHGLSRSKPRLTLFDCLVVFGHGKPFALSDGRASLCIRQMRRGTRHASFNHCLRFVVELRPLSRCRQPWID